MNRTEIGSLSVMSTKSNIPEPLTATTLIITEAKEDKTTCKGSSVRTALSCCLIMIAPRVGSNVFKLKKVYEIILN